MIRAGVLERDPRCLLLIFEAVRPFRGIQFRGRVSLVVDVGAEARLAMASPLIHQAGASA